ncbi:mucin-2 [Streptomyces sp. NPDC085524]|uniref:mucin-2 n=1 Tax=unclassified Streptomyces TaxID=2593676 RepID=UPI0035D9D413
MPWFRIDDTSHAHPKMLKAGNAAIGLWMRTGAYAAQHLTEGAVPGVIAQLYGTPAQARKLTAAGLWHEQGHGCARCPQPPAGDYVMHDYLVYNPTRAKVEDDRTQAADRQKRAREKAAEQRNQVRNPRGSSGSRSRTDDDAVAEPWGSGSHQIAFPDDIAAQDRSSRRDAPDASRSPRPGPSPVPPPEVQPVSSGARVPANVEPLRDAMTAAGIVVPWELSTADWFRLEAVLARTSVAALVDHARGAWHHARSRPRSVRYFLPGWTALPPVPEGTPTSPSADVIPIGAARPSTTDQRVAAGMDLAARLRAQESPA